MRSVSFSLAGVEDHYFVIALVGEYIGPFFFDCSVEPHELVLGASFDFAIVLGVEELELIFQLFGWGLRSEEDDAEGAFSTETDISGTSMIEFRD